MPKRYIVAAEDTREIRVNFGPWWAPEFAQAFAERLNGEGEVRAWVEELRDPEDLREEP